MEHNISSLINSYYKEKNIKYKIRKDSNKIIITNPDIVTDVDLLRYILLNIKIDRKSNYTYCTYMSKTCKFYFSNEMEEKDLNLIYSNIIQTYYENTEDFVKYVKILSELKSKNLINVIENVFRKENSDEIKIFSKMVFYYINNYSNDSEKMEYFIYTKKFDSLKYKNKIQEMMNENNRMPILFKECFEIFDIFDEIYDTKIFNNLNKGIVELDKINNNKLLITNEVSKIIIQMVITNNTIAKIEPLIKKIKNIFKNEQEIILFVNKYDFDSLFLLFKEGFLTNLIIKNPLNKNLLMLNNNKDLFLYYDYNEINNTEKIIEDEYNYIDKYLNNYFENLYLVFNIDYKIHKVKINKFISKFGFFIKDRVEQNYFNINEYNEERGNYSLYLYSENNTLCFEIFCLKYPIFKKLFSLFLKSGEKLSQKKDDLNSLIAIKGYDLILKCSNIIKEIYYEKIIFQESIDIEDDYLLKSDFEKILNKKNSCFNAKNIYIVENIEDYLDKKNKLPSNLIKSYNKRGFNDLLPAFYFIHKKYPILNKKPIILQISHFMSYNLNIYKNKEE